MGSWSCPHFYRILATLRARASPSGDARVPLYGHIARLGVAGGGSHATQRVAGSRGAAGSVRARLVLTLLRQASPE